MVFIWIPIFVSIPELPIKIEIAAIGFGSIFLEFGNEFKTIEFEKDGSQPQSNYLDKTYLKSHSRRQPLVFYEKRLTKKSLKDETL